MAPLILVCINKSTQIISLLKLSPLKMYTKTGNHHQINLYKTLFKILTKHTESMM